MMSKSLRILSVGTSVGLLLAFQNCSKVTVSDIDPSAKVTSTSTPGDPGTPIIGCGEASCELTPLTSKAAVTTILLSLGSETTAGLVINGASSQLIAETMIRKTSPVTDPKILLVADDMNYDENPEDTTYAKSVLLKRYQTSVKHVGREGLKPADVKGYDLVWYNNPGYAMGSRTTLATLLAFEGGVILQGDDLSLGQDDQGDFSLSELTGLEFVDFGTEVVCQGKILKTDNNGSTAFNVFMDPDRLVAQDQSTLNFQYTNDIDLTKIVNEKVEIYATAIADAAECTEPRPAIVRLEREIHK